MYGEHCTIYVCKTQGGDRSVYQVSCITRGTTWQRVRREMGGVEVMISNRRWNIYFNSCGYHTVAITLFPFSVSDYFIYLSLFLSFFFYLSGTIMQIILRVGVWLLLPHPSFLPEKVSVLALSHKYLFILLSPPTVMNDASSLACGV